MRLAPSFLLASLIAATALGQSPALPRLPDSTFGVLRGDLDQVDAAAMFKSMADAINADTATPASQKAAVIKTLAEAQADVTRWTDAFRKAGGKRAYVVFDATVISGQQPAVIVPLEAGLDEQAITNLLTTGDAATAAPKNGPTTVLRVEDALIAGPTASVGRYKTLAPKPRPEIAAALDAAGASPVRFAFVPTVQLKGFAEAGLPNLPPQLGGGPTTDLTRNLTWLALGLATPPEPKLSLALQSPTPEGAATLSQILTQGLDALAQDPTANQRLPGLGKALAQLKPQVEGSTVRAGLQGETMQGLLTQMAISMHQAREAALSVKSVTNERQLLMAVHMYAAENNGALPADLASLGKYVSKPATIDELLTNPRDPERKDAYVYLRPAEKMSLIANPPRTVLIHEAYDAWPGKLVVGFADGHVEMIGDEAQFKALLANK